MNEAMPAKSGHELTGLILPAVTAIGWAQLAGIKYFFADWPRYTGAMVSRLASAVNADPAVIARPYLVKLSEEFYERVDHAEPC